MERSGGIGRTSLSAEQAACLKGTGTAGLGNRWRIDVWYSVQNEQRRIYGCYVIDHTAGGANG